ncbi:MAG: hypothetical protein EOM50_15635 [Erysipelotrichia bacterium]|uniref:hypothetical protein n=1 Tax=Sulfurospirillum cavolei TaxID=366522 RepID=UPI0005A619F4|nr:hypothetical protein [Sulfurospirillum cavolei]NBK99419.1 hypothetical protein [Erysipelotrichia bacterium]
MSLDVKMIENITKQTNEAQNQHLRLFAKVELPLKLQILQLQKPLFHKLKSAYSDVDSAVLTFASLILAINSIVKETDKVNFNAMKIRGKNQKTKIKREKLLGYWAIVKALKLEQNMSFRDISSYFKKYHKFEVSYSTIRELWIELENKTNIEEN